MYSTLSLNVFVYRANATTEKGAKQNTETVNKGPDCTWKTRKTIGKTNKESYEAISRGGGGVQTKKTFCEGVWIFSGTAFVVPMSLL